MKKLFLIITILISVMALSAQLVSAQTSSSAGCTAFAMTSGTADDTFTASFTTGEVITLSVTSADGGLFDVTIAGNLLLNDAPTGSSTNYTVLADGNVTIEVTVTVGTGTYSISCTPLDTDDDDDAASDGVLCHYPPGNPAAAHTIRVGSENAVQTHVSKHGDTLGACAPGVQTRADIPSVNITIFVIYATDSIQVYGDCTDTCQEVLNTPIVLLIDLDLVVINIGDFDDDDQDDDDTAGGDFIYVDNPEDYGFILGEITTDGLYVVIYYLHPDPENTSVGVFQINVYDSGSLLDDSILVFINSSGDIIQWTDHSYWEEQLQESFEDGS